MSLEQLTTQGFTVIPVPWMTQIELANIRKEIDLEIKGFQEFKPDANEFVLGGFSAFGNPSSFHCGFVRKMREKAFMEVFELLKSFIHTLPHSESYRLEQIIDRLMIRQKGKSPVKESWHRDEAKLALDTDKIFGGWWNFDSQSQFFSCVPGTHTEVSGLDQGHRGFGTIKDKAEIDRYNKQKQLVEIPPGHILVSLKTWSMKSLVKKPITTCTVYFWDGELHRAKNPSFRI